MNTLTIPSSPNWYETDIMACAPDNTLLYGSRQDIVVIKSTPENDPDDVHIIAKAHAVRVISINTNKNWGTPHKYAVTVSEDKIIKLWDIENLEKKLSHNKHVSLDKSKVIGASFAGDDRVVSASENGSVVIWNLIKNETNVLTTLFNTKVSLTCLSVCPHSTWLAGFGLKSGLVVVADLRRTGKVLHTLRGHSKAVVSLAWCPAPINIFPSTPRNVVIEEKIAEELKVKILDKVSTPDKPSEGPAIDKIDRRKQKNPQKEPCPWTECYFVDDIQEEKIKIEDKEGDFLKECLALRKNILELGSQDPKDKGADAVSSENSAPRKTLRARTKNRDFSVSDLLSKKDLPLETLAAGPMENPDTPPDIRVLAMDISGVTPKVFTTDSIEKPDTPTDTRILPMDISCSTQKICTKIVTSVDKPIDGATLKEALAKLDASGSSEESRNFSSASSCDSELICSKKRKDILNMEVPKKGDSFSDSGEVFHDARNDPKLVTGDEEVENWRTEEPVSVEEAPRKEFLLASSAREPNIYIWRAGTDGRMQTFMTVPSPKTTKSYKKSSRSSDRLWITLCWVSPQVLLSSSRTAELLEWTLPKPLLQSKFLRTIHRDHWSVLFSIKAPIEYRNEYNFLQKKDVGVWTTGMDRMVINTDLGSARNLACYPALGGSVNCLSGSLLDPNRLAIGTGEGIVNLWDLSRAHKKSIDFSVFYQKIFSGVTALAWHPAIETSLAWGTVEGRIGLMEVTSKAKQSKILPHFFKSQIHKLEWGPLNPETHKQKLFVVSESRVAIFDPKSDEKDPEILELPDNTLVFTMAWKPDYSMLLVSSKSGTLITYSPDLKISNISYLSQKLESILWHPDAASDDASVSKYCKTFVSVIKYSEFAVFDLSVQSEDHKDRVFGQFDNRGVKISSLAWSPHSGKYLVVADEGGVAQVYDIESKSVISTYINPCLDPLLSVLWSPADPDYVIVGSASHKIIVWKVSDHPALTESEINSLKNKISKAQQKEASDQVVKDKEEQTSNKEGEASKGKSQRKSQVVPLFYSMKEKTLVQDMQKLLQWKLGDKNVEAKIGDDKNLDVLDVFADQGNMGRVFDLNLLAFKQQGKHQRGNLLALFQGDISTVINEAIEQKRVNPWIISMCPMVSPKLWQTACETYVQQLLDEPEADELEIVTYLLACHKVEKAVRFLCERQLFREALALAKARFGGDNAVVNEILDQWAKNNVYQGNFELASCCYITLGKFEDAASVLFRRSNVELLEVAADLAKLSENKELHKAVVFRLNAFKMEETKKMLESQDISKDATKISGEASKDNTQEIKVDKEITKGKADDGGKDELEEKLVQKLREISLTSGKEEKQEKELGEEDKANDVQPSTSHEDVCGLSPFSEDSDTDNASTEVVVDTRDTEETERALDQMHSLFLKNKRAEQEGVAIEKIKASLARSQKLIEAKERTELDTKTEPDGKVEDF